MHAPAHCVVFCCLLLQDGGGGGGGGDGWNWERTARNLMPNLAFLGMYFMITSYGGDGWGGGESIGNMQVAGAGAGRSSCEGGSDSSNREH